MSKVHKSPPAFGLCPYGNNIWMHKFQHLSYAQSVLLYILTPKAPQGKTQGQLKHRVKGLGLVSSIPNFDFLA